MSQRCYVALSADRPGDPDRCRRHRVLGLHHRQADLDGDNGLTTQSQNRAPEQDAVLSIGYVDYINQDTYQQLLRAKSWISSDVVLKGATGPASPIIYIEAVAPMADRARSAADSFYNALHQDPDQRPLTPFHA